MKPDQATSMPRVLDARLDTLRSEGHEVTADPEKSGERSVGRARAFITSPAVAAALTWVVATPIAFILPRIPAYEGGAGSLRSIGLPLSVGLAAVGVILLAALRRPAPWLAGVAAGGLSAWLVMILSTAMRGTPFPFFGLLGDSGRITAMATRYTVTPFSSDAMIPGLPSEYPLLFPWLIGRASLLLDIPAWRLVGDFEILFTGLAVLAGFVLWQRLLSPWAALAVTALGFMTFANPAKSYEVMTLMMFIPWVLLTFMTPPRGRLHWLASGAVGGLIVLTYYGWFVFGFFGVAAISLYTWRKEQDRRRFLLYLVKVAATALIVSSWFVIPLLYAKVTIGGSTVADLYGTAGMLDQMFPFLDVTILGLLQLVGLVGLIWLRDKTWWAAPLLALAVGAFLYRVLGALLFVLTEHTALSQYTPRVYMHVLTIGGVLTIIHAAPRLLSRLSLTAPKGGVAIALALALAWCGFSFAMDWTPGMHGRYATYSERAYREPYPDGHYVSGIDQPTPWFPVTPIQKAVEGVIGTNHNAVALSVDERLWAYLPWAGYLGNDLGSSVSHTHERLAEVERLVAISDPAAFTRESANLKFGRIDIFVLRKKDGAWQWTFHRGFNQPEAELNFTRAQFDPAHWAIIDDLPEGVVVTVRK